MASKALYEQLNIFALGEEAYVLEPAGSRFPRRLTIHRISGELRLEDTPFGKLNAALKPLTVYGIMGIISLATSEYLIVITKRELKGQFLGHSIYRASSFELLPLQSSSTPPQVTERYLLSLIKSHLNGSLLWFSYDWDLTRRLQAQYVARPGDVGKALWESADDRFFWNRYLQAPLIDHTRRYPEQDLSPFILPVLCGTFDIRKTSIASFPISFALISRRSRYRAGTRYFRRGVDHNGHVANFNETEQIVIVIPNKSKVTVPPDQDGPQSMILSFVQTRGSVPVYWAEVNNLRYKPDLQVMEQRDTLTAMSNHLQEQFRLYGPQILVNLLNQKGHEKPVKDAFENYLAQLPQEKINYTYFDFHRECCHMRWDRVDILLEQLQENLIQQGYFLEDQSCNRPPLYQIGNVRTNCLDNLDRTNVIQSALAKWMLTRQLRDLNLLSETDIVDNYSEFMTLYRNMWADHANEISMSYSGTGALKTDFTRTGKRTRKGALQDGYNSVVRYFRNNFFDGPRQDAFDLVTGSWTVRRGRLSTMNLLLDNRPLIIQSMPFVFYIACFMICAGLTLPRSSDLPLTFYFVVWIVVLAAALAFIIMNGIDYVNWPRLIPLTDAIEYHGPGAKTGRKGRGVPFIHHDKRRFFVNLKSQPPRRKDDIDYEAKERLD